MACAYCGDVFMTVRSDAKFCSPSHRTMAHRDRKADAAAADLDRARHDPEYRD